jgi:hypothetical protein
VLVKIFETIDDVVEFYFITERGWSSRVDEILEFNTRELAEKYAKEYNEKHNNQPTVPDWYIRAEVER